MKNRNKRRNKSRNYSVIVFSSSGWAALHPAALSPEMMIQGKIGAIYTGWQGQLAGIGPGRFEVWSRVKFKIGGQVVIRSWEPDRPCVSWGRWSTLFSGWRILTFVNMALQRKKNSTLKWQSKFLRLNLSQNNNQHFWDLKFCDLISLLSEMF